MLGNTLKDIFARLRLVYDEVRLNVDVTKKEIADSSVSRLPTPTVDKDKVAIVQTPEPSFPPQFRALK